MVGAQEKEKEQGEEGGEQGDGDQPGPGVSRQNVCVINACQVSYEGSKVTKYMLCNVINVLLF